MDTNKSKVYVADTDENMVSDINENNMTIKYIPVDSSPYNIAIDTNKGKVYVTNFKSNTVSVIDENTDTVMNKSIQVGMVPLGIAYRYK